MCRKCWKVCGSIWYFTRGVSVKSYRFADRLWPECDGPSASSSPQRSDFLGSIHLTSNAPVILLLRIWLRYQMQLFLWKRLQIGVLNAAWKEIGARLIGKAHSWNFGHSKYFCVKSIKMFRRSQSTYFCIR